MLLFTFVLVLLVDLHVEADLVVEGCDGMVQCRRRRGRAGRHRLAVIGREISHRSFGIRHSFVIPLTRKKNQFWAIQSRKEWHCSWNVRLFELVIAPFDNFYSGLWSKMMIVRANWSEFLSNPHQMLFRWNILNKWNLPFLSTCSSKWKWKWNPNLSPSEEFSASSQEQHPQETFSIPCSAFVLVFCLAFSLSSWPISSRSFLLARSAFSNFLTRPLTSM